MSANPHTNYTPPRPQPGKRSATLYPDWADGEPVVCHYEYTAGEPMTQHLPGEPEEWVITDIYIRGWSCGHLLSNQMVEDLERDIKEKHENHRNI